MFAIMLQGMDGVWRVWCYEDNLQRAQSTANHYERAGVKVRVVAVN